MSGSYGVGTNYLAFTAGSAGAAGTGAFTVVVLVNPAVGNNGAGWLGLYASATLNRALFEDALKVYGNNDFSSGFGALTQGTWYVIACTKPAGSAPYRFHVWPYASDGSGTMAHGTSTGAANQGDGSTITDIRVGANAVPSNGLIAAAGLWTVELTDSDLDGFKSANLSSWTTVTPAELISLENWNGSTGANVLIGTAAFSGVTGTVSSGANPSGFNFTLSSPQTVAAAGVSSSSAVGAPDLVQVIAAAGVASASTVGAPSVAPGPVTVAAAGASSSSAVGAPAVDPGPVTIAAAGVSSSSTVGAPAIDPGPVTLAPIGVPSSGTAGLPALLSIATITLTGVASVSTVGAPDVTPGPPIITPAGIASSSAVGQPAVAVGDAVLVMAGVASASVVGHPAVARQAAGDGLLHAATARVTLTAPAAAVTMTP